MRGVRVYPLSGTGSVMVREDREMTNDAIAKERREISRLNDLGWQEKSDGKSRRFEKEDEISFPSQN